ncbi:hypothetical protein DVH05_028619 [Phytophthora capsici]|nr:hypothetical protein DVH05_028619 [Phytophthora capsici]KAG1709942.1 hypothetical protein DVH05_028619 [Phytophthora capsici]
MLSRCVDVLMEREPDLALVAGRANSGSAEAGVGSTMSPSLRRWRKSAISCFNSPDFSRSRSSFTTGPVAVAVEPRAAVNANVFVCASIPRDRTSDLYAGDVVSSLKPSGKKSIMYATAYRYS